MGRSPSGDLQLLQALGLGSLHPVEGAAVPGAPWPARNLACCHSRSGCPRSGRRTPSDDGAAGCDGIRQLDLATPRGILRISVKISEVRDVAARHAQSRGRFFWAGFSTMCAMSSKRSETSCQPRCRSAASAGRHLLHRDDGRAPLRYCSTICWVMGFAHHQVIGQQHGKGFPGPTAFGWRTAPHAQAQHLGLAHVHATMSSGDRAHHRQQLCLPAALQLGLQLVGHVEMVFDGRLVRPVTKIIWRMPPHRLLRWRIGSGVCPPPASLWAGPWWQENGFPRPGDWENGFGDHGGLGEGLDRGRGHPATNQDPGSGHAMQDATPRIMTRKQRCSMTLSSSGGPAGSMTAALCRPQNLNPSAPRSPPGWGSGGCQ